MKHFNLMKIKVEANDCRTTPISVTQESDSTSFGSDDNENNVKYRNGLFKNNLYYQKIILSEGSSPLNYTVAVHGNLKINFCSYSSLFNRTWVENYMIDFYFSHIQTNHNQCKIMSIHVASILFTDPDLTDEEIKDLAEEFANNWNYNASIILMPILNVMREHFYLIAFDMTKAEFAIVDSAKINRRDEAIRSSISFLYDKHFNRFSCFLEHLYKKTKIAIPKNIKKKYFPVCNKQQGNDDCGVFVIIHMEQYIQHGSYLIDKTINVSEKRNGIRDFILSKSDRMYDLCLVCGENINEKEGEFIRCSSCHRYVHDFEIKINIDDIDKNKKFYCPLCRLEKQ